MNCSCSLSAPVAAAAAAPIQEAARFDRKAHVCRINTEYTTQPLNHFTKKFEDANRGIYNHRKEIATTIAELGLRPGQSVADIGAGTGFLSVELSEKVGEKGQVYAIDPHEVFVSNLPKHRNIQSVKSCDTSLNMGNKQVDVALICDAYHHFVEPQAMMEDVWRTLAPNGILVLIDFDKELNEWTKDHICCTRQEFIREIESAGFKLEKEVVIEGLENYCLKFSKIQTPVNDEEKQHELRAAAAIIAKKVTNAK